jgi:hypothetical protein
MLSGLSSVSKDYAGMMYYEKKVAEFLDQLGLPWIFEFPIFVYDERKRPRVWAPDFFIPKLGVYIEVCGSDEFNYKYREKIYNDNNILVIFVHLYKEQRKWKKFLFLRIKEVEKQRHAEAMELIANVATQLSLYL